MIKRDQFDKISSSGGSGSGASQTEIYQIFEGTNPQGFADSLFYPYLDAGNKGIAFWLYLIREKLNEIDTNTTNIESNTGTQRTPQIISTTTTGSINNQLHRISFANVGNANATITVNGNTVNLPVGVTVNYEAGGNNNRFPSNIFSYNGTGTSLLITYVE